MVLIFIRMLHVILVGIRNKLLKVQEQNATLFDIPRVIYVCYIRTCILTLFHSLGFRVSSGATFQYFNKIC